MGGMAVIPAALKLSEQAFAEGGIAKDILFERVNDAVGECGLQIALKQGEQQRADFLTGGVVARGEGLRR